MMIGEMLSDLRQTWKESTKENSTASSSSLVLTFPSTRHLTVYTRCEGSLLRVNPYTLLTYVNFLNFCCISRK